MTRFLKPILFLLALAQGSSAFPSDLLSKPDSWFNSPEGKSAVTHVLSWQSDHGSWPKNRDNSKKPYPGDRKKLKGTFDNGSTTDELRFLARAYRATNDPSCLTAFLTGFDGILAAQFPNGGFPQYFPLSKQYHRHITFNDNSMVRILEFLRETYTGDSFTFLDSDRRSAARKSFDLGISCIVKCQIIVGGRPTVWCAQHDEVTLAPAPARAYELESLSGSESAGILRLLMSLDNPSPDVIRAVKAGAEWFESSAITGSRYERIGKERRLTRDPSAPPLWARFYDLDSGKPFFCDRDAVKKHDIMEIGAERRNGYAWYGNWGDSVLKAYAKWSYR